MSPKPMPEVKATKHVVYFGIGLAGRTTNLEVLHKKAPALWRSELVSRPWGDDGDRILAFTVVLRGASIALELIAVPQAITSVAEKNRRKGLALADAIVWVVDSQPDKLEEQRPLVREIEEGLAARGLDPRTFPLVIQWAKRDLPGVLPVETLARELNPWGAPTFEAVPVTGRGVRDPLQAVLDRFRA